MSNRIKRLEEKRNRQREPTTNRTVLINARGDPVSPVGIAEKIMIVIDFEHWEEESISQQEKLIAQHSKGV